MAKEQRHTCSKKSIQAECCCLPFSIWVDCEYTSPVIPQQLQLVFPQSFTLIWKRHEDPERKDDAQAPV